MIGFFFYLTIVLFILVCLFMILLILIQKGRGGGLASAFGGAGGNTAFGSKTGDVLTWATSIVFGVFLVLAVALNLFADARNRSLTAANAAAESATTQPALPGAGSPGPFSIPTTPDPGLGSGTGRGTQPPAPIGSDPGPSTVPVTAPGSGATLEPAAAAPTTPTTPAGPVTPPASNPPAPAGTPPAADAPVEK